MEASHNFTLLIRLSRDEARLIGLALARKLKPRDFHAARDLNLKLIEQRQKALQEELHVVTAAASHAQQDTKESE